jgi:hypothetical protein
MSHYALHLAGRNYGKLGTVVANPPDLTITGFASSHALHRAVGRDVTTQERYETLRNPLVVLEQRQGYSYLFLSERAVVVVNTVGQLITTYGASDFDEGIQKILHDAGAV